MLRIHYLLVFAKKTKNKQISQFIIHNFEMRVIRSRYIEREKKMEKTCPAKLSCCWTKQEKKTPARKA